MTKAALKKFLIRASLVWRNDYATRTDWIIDQFDRLGHSCISLEIICLTNSFLDSKKSHA
jgi:hypothetical protein